jgi:hypothetical protein
MTSTVDIATALAAVSDGELCELRANLAGEATVAPGLTGWLEAAADWEMARRAGQRREFPDPCQSADEGEADCGRIVLAILHAAFGGDDRIHELLDVTAEVLCSPRNGAPGIAF